MPTRPKSREESFDDDEEFDPDEDIDDGIFIEGSTKATDDVTKFIEGVRNSPDVQGTLIIQLVFSSTVAETNIKKFQYRLGDARELAKEIIDRAEEEIHRGTMRGTVRFAVVALDKRQYELERMKFTLKVPSPEKEETEIGTADVDPSFRGLVSQTMDVNLQYAKMIAKMSTASDRLLRDVIQDLRSENAALTRGRVETLRITEELVDMKFRRDMMIEEKKKQEERKDMVMRMAIPLAMSVFGGQAAGLLPGMGGPPPGPPPSPPMAGPPQGHGGQGGPPPGPRQGPEAPSDPAAESAPIDAVIASNVEGLIGSITPEQVQQLAMSGLFSQEQLMQLFALSELAKKKREASPSSSVEGNFDPPARAEPAPQVEVTVQPWKKGFSPR